MFIGSPSLRSTLGNTDPSVSSEPVDRDELSFTPTLAEPSMTLGQSWTAPLVINCVVGCWEIPMAYGGLVR